MKQIFYGTGGYVCQDVPMPTPGNNEILVAVHTSVISTGTETMVLQKNEKTIVEILEEKKALLDKVRKLIRENGISFTVEAIKNKLNPKERSMLFSPVGYSNAGVVIAKGHLVRNFNIGDRVACAGAGFASHSEYVTIPINLAVKIPDNLNFEAAGFTTIGAIAMQGIRRANVTFGETVVITGLGLLGLLAVQIAKAWGLVVIGIDINPNRVLLGKELGADYGFLANEPDLYNSVRDITQGNGADAVIIYAATKHSGPANQALSLCRKRGRVVVVGSIGMDLQRDEMYTKELDFVMSTSYGPGRYDKEYELKGVDYPIGYVRWTENRNMMEFIRLISTNQVKLDSLISETYNIEQASEAYERLIQSKEDNISNIFRYSHEIETTSETRKTSISPKIISGKIGVGIIGAGSFVQANHLANILSMPEIFDVIGIAQKSPVSAKLAGEKYKVKSVTTNYKELLSDQNIHLVVIGTRHNLHAIQVIEAIKAGKHVLVEKPLAMNLSELSLIEKAIQDNPNVVVTTGFNRRYSPLTQKVRDVILKAKMPVVINYRINAGYIPPESWIQDLEEGGGRIVGEVCHFIDLIMYLASGEVTDLNAVHVPQDGRKIESEDNIIISLAFDNGSIGVLTYTSIGGKAMEKERLEVFVNGSSLVINDFKELAGFECDFKKVSLKVQDKGHKVLISELSKSLRNETSQILPVASDIEATKLTLLALDKIHSVH